MFSNKLDIMMKFLRNRGLSSVALALTSLLTVANAPISATLDQRVLAAHNVARQQLGLAPLRWNPHLAEVAATRASQLATSHTFAHAPDDALSPQGENIWGGTKGYYSPEAMVNAWADEKQYFKRGVFPDNSTTGKVDDVGHFTQMAWKDTTEVGCGIARDNHYDILVCRYSPAGNYLGEIPF